jgi:hypothetical protein
MRKELYEIYTEFKKSPSKCFDGPRIVVVMWAGGDIERKERETGENHAVRSCYYH